MRSIAKKVITMIIEGNEDNVFVNGLDYNVSVIVLML